MSKGHGTSVVVASLPVDSSTFTVGLLSPIVLGFIFQDEC